MSTWEVVSNRMRALGDTGSGAQGARAEKVNDERIQILRRVLPWTSRGVCEGWPNAACLWMVGGVSGRGGSVYAPWLITPFWYAHSLYASAQASVVCTNTFDPGVDGAFVGLLARSLMHPVPLA